MPPKNLAALTGSPEASPNDHLAQQHESLLNTSERTMPPSEPPSPSKELPPPPDTMGSSGPAETQGMAEPAAERKRKAATTSSGDDTSAEPATKRKRAAAAVAKKPAVKKRSPKKDFSSQEAVAAEAKQPSAPLTRAIKSKLLAVDTFLDTHTVPLIARSEGSNSNVGTVNGLDLLAALIILRVDYHVENSSTEVSLEDAGDVIVAHLDAGKVSVDFDKICDTERAVQAKLAGRGTGLEDVNLLEVEMEMLVAKRKQLVEDEEPDAGFRVYGCHTKEGDTVGQTSPEEV